MKRLRTFLPAILCGSAALLSQPTHAATFTWANTSGNWSAGPSWNGGVAPSGTNPLDVLVFGGNVGTPATPTRWVSSNDFTSFVLNRMDLTGVDVDPTNSNLQHLIQQNLISLVGNPADGNFAYINQAGSANVTIEAPIDFTGTLQFAGSGTGTVTINAGISGTGDIVKIGDATFRFGTTPPGAQPPPGSSNTWVGNLMIAGGEVRFNNNAQAASSALRANSVTFAAPGFLSSKRDGGDEQQGYETSLRMGNLNSAAGIGSVFAGVEGSNTKNYDIVITALQTGDYGGSIQLSAGTGAGADQDPGDLVIRGPGTQIFRGNMIIEKDVHVGYGATMSLASDVSGFPSHATLANQTKGAIIFTGGTLKLDNTQSNVAGGRLRDADQGSSTVETIGGGTLQLIGNAAGTTELTGRLQLGSGSNLRSGHMKIEVVHQSTTAGTQLTFGSYSRNVALQQLTTVEFGAKNGANATLNLGSAGVSPRILLSNPAEAVPFTVPLVNGLLASTGSGGTPSVGWAVVNSTTGLQFAGYNTTNGVVGVQGDLWAGASSPTTNARVTTTLDTAVSGPATPIELNSLRIVPSGSSSALNIMGNGSLSTTAFLLATGFDYAINATGGATIGGNGTRYFHVQQANLTVNAPVTGSAFPIVKAGEGTLTLTAATNVNLNQTVAINGGALRATPGQSLPQGEVRLRGGQLEITGGGTFSRNIGFGSNTINWSGVSTGPLGETVGVAEDRGSGGFAAVGADVTIDLGLIGPTLFSWEDTGFVRSGYALVFGSNSATNRVTWTDNLSLSDADPTVVNYNAREIRVLNNPASLNDSARITGTISGRLQNDLLKTGSGDLELTGVNTYTGATIVHGGRLYVNDTGDSSSSFLHKVMTGATVGGNGRIGDVLVDGGGILAPGKGAAIASIFRTKNLEFIDNSSQFRIDIGGITAGGDSASGYDQLQVTGTVTLNDADLVASFVGGFNPTTTDLLFLILNDGLDPVIGQFADGTQITIGGHLFNISYEADSTLNQFTGGNDVALQLVPEPSSVALMGLGALALVRRRRGV